MTTRAGRADRLGEAFSRGRPWSIATLVLAAALAVASALDLLGLDLLDLWPAALLVGTNLLVGYSAWRLVRAVSASDDWTEVVLDTGVVAASMIVFTVLILGSLGILTLSAAVLAIGLEGVALVSLTDRASARTTPIRWPTLRRWHLGIFAGLVLFEIAQVFYANWLLPPSDDALGYHLPFAVEWMQSQRFSMPIPAAGSPNPPFYPLNSSILMAWLMLPMPGDLIVRFVEAPFLALLLLAGVRLGRSLGLDDAPSWVAAILVVSLPDVVRSIAIAGNDLILAALLFVAVASLAELWGRPTLWRLILGVLALGLGLGTKESALPYVAVLGLAYVVAAWKGWHRERWPRVVRLWVVEVVVVLAAGSYSYARNLVVMGNPFYPLTYKLGGRVIFEGLYEATAEWKQNHPYYPFDWLGLLTNSRADFGYAIPLVAVLGGIAAAAVAIRRRQVGPLALLAWTGLSVGIFWYVLPVHDTRFLYASVGWAVILGVWGWQATLSRWRPWLIVPALALVAISAASVPKHSDVLTSVPYLAVGLAAVAGTAGAILALSQLSQMTQRRVFAGAGAAALVLALAILPLYARVYDAHRAEQWARVTVPLDQEPLAWDWLTSASEGPESLVVDVAGTNAYYPLYGPDLDNRVIRVAPDGTVAGYDWDQPSDLAGPPSEASWLAALDRENVRYLYVASNGVDGSWPVEATWAAGQSERFKPVLTESDVRVWEVVN